jgi:hypothetical protein
MAQDSGLVKRGLLVLGLIAVLAGVVLFVMFRRPGQALPDEPPEGVTASPKGWEVRYNATLGLARRGSGKVRLDVLAEMLDEHKQMKNFRAKVKGGPDVPDEAAARATVLSALKAIIEWHEKGGNSVTGVSKQELEALYGALDRLTRSPNLVVRTEAERTRRAIGR